MDVSIAELEESFRRSWVAYSPHRYDEFLRQTTEAHRLELLTRMLSVELEYAFQPPSSPAVAVDVVGEDEQRVKPCVTLFLLKFPDLAQRPELVIRLIVLEYALRLRYDENAPNPESYLPYCESRAEQLLQLLELAENKLPTRRSDNTLSKLASHSDSTVKESAASESVSPADMQLNLGCFLLIRLLGRGGMGYVHAAIDLRSTAQVAVKVMRRADAWSIYRFIEEFRWLSHLAHPNLVRLYDAFCEGDVRYFSMELVEGKTVREWFWHRAGLESRWDDLRKILGQLASAVHYLHEHGVVHCDIKCSNMMIASKGRAVLLDLGLAIRAGDQNRMVGTLQYMAPEITRGDSSSYASDWYSFGVMIYEVATNRFPPTQVQCADATETKGFNLDYEKLQAGLKDCPEDLAALCCELMSLLPGDRPRGADVVRRLNGRQTPSADVEQAVCDGREAELQQIISACYATKNSCSRLVVLQGQSGIGKSTLLRAAIEKLFPESELHNSGLLLSVKCYRQDHTPVRLLNALVQELVIGLQSVSPETWKPALEDRIDAIRQLFPQVQQLLLERSFSTLKSLSQRETFSDSLRELGITSFIEWLLQLSRFRRLIIVVDDAQWADIESLRTLKRLLSHTSGFQGTVVLVDESDERRIMAVCPQGDAAFENGNPPFPITEIELQPLGSSTCEAVLYRLARSAEIEMRPTVASDIAARSSGNPFLLQEMFRTYRYYANRREQAGGDWFEDDSQRSVQRRFSMLPRQTESVLQFLAVADQSLTFHQLQMVSRIVPHELQSELSLLSSQGWIRSHGSELESDVEISHEHFRRAILQSLPPDRLHRRHYRMARVLSSESTPAWARIAGHYWAAERYREAAACYLEAARVALATGAALEALEFLQRANHPDAERTASEQRRVKRMTADCLARIGRSQAAAEHYDQMIDDDQSREETTILRCLSGEQWIRAGHLEQGVARLKIALAELGVVPRRRSRFAYVCLSCRTLRLAFTKPTIDRGGTTNVTSSCFGEMERCLNRLTPPMTYLDNQLGPELILRMTDLANKCGSQFDRALAHCRAGILLSFGGRRWRKRAIQWLRVGRSLARASKSDEARATADFCTFVWHVQQGRTSAAVRAGHSALRRYQSCAAATQWEQQFLESALLSTYWYSNRLQKLTYSVEKLRKNALDRDDPMSTYWTHVDSAHVADLILDQTTAAQSSLQVAQSAVANQVFESPRFFSWLSRVRQLLYENDADKALRVLKGDWRRLDASLVMRTSHYRWLSLSLRICCYLLVLRSQDGNRSQLVADAQSSVKQLLRLKEPVFADFGAAYSLAVEAAAGRVAGQSAWRAISQRLRSRGHDLLAIALEWQYGCYATIDLREQICSAAESQFIEEGCVAPKKLLNLILPLPKN